MISRRSLLKSSAVASLSLALPGLAFDTNATNTAKRFLLVILRGGMDGLAAVPPWQDSHYRRARGELALESPDAADGVLDLDGFFGLHPRLRSAHDLYRAGELVAIHGIAPPYSRRSHFDAQNVLECGSETPFGMADGWLYRSIAGYDKAKAPEVAMALGPSIPLVLRGETSIASWAPDRLPSPDDDTLSRVLALYQDDAILGPRFDAMMSTDSMLSDMEDPGARGAGLQGQLIDAAARALRLPDGPRIAVLESGGWDTHANQGSTGGTLAGRLSGIDAMLGRMKTSLGDVWNDTAIAIVTEFGRTVAMNGTRGTDHGVGGVALLVGGSVRGGQVIADWPGLARDRLFEGRDLMPTLDQRQLFKAILIDHLGIEVGLVEDAVFPRSRHQASLPGLFRSQRA